MGVRTNAGVLSRYGAHRQPIGERKLAIYEVCGKTDTEVRGYSATGTPISFHRLILPGGQPELYLWEILADLNDLHEVVHTLHVAGVMPTKVSVSGAVDERCYGIHPPRIGEAVEPPLHRRLDFPKYVSAA